MRLGSGRTACPVSNAVLFWWHPAPLSRKLTWIYTLGTAVLRGNFDSKPIEMQMNTLQAALCVLLNDVDELSYQEV